MRPMCIADYETLARRRLPRALFGFASHGSESQTTLRANRAALDNFFLVPNVLCDIAARTSRTELFGRAYSAPFGIAPMGGAALFHHRADLVLAQQAYAHDIPFVLSAASSVPLEAIADAAPGCWYQAYLPANQDEILALLERLKRTSIGVLVITADVPVPANRYADRRLGFRLPLRPTPSLLLDLATHPTWLCTVATRTLASGGIPRFENYGATPGGWIIRPPDRTAVAARQRLCWEHVSFIRRNWAGKLLIKGVLRVDDALKANQAGVDGLVISNHGGRQLDGAIASLDALRFIRSAMPDMTLILDSGLRSGTDILKALAAGANFVLMGRPFLYALSARGPAGLAHAIALLQQELDTSMALLGVSTPADVHPTHAVHHHSLPQSSSRSAGLHTQ